MTEVSSEAGTAMATAAGVPHIVAEVRADGTGFLMVDTEREEIVGDDLAAVGAQITGRISGLASKIGAPLPAEVRDPDGLWVLLIHPDGRVDEAPSLREGGPHTVGPASTGSSLSAAVGTAAPGPSASPSQFPRTGVPADLAGHRAPVTGSPAPARSSLPAAAPPPSPGEPASDGAPVVSGAPTEAALGQDLATRHRPRRQAASRGWRAGLRWVTFGLVQPAPGLREQIDRAAVESVRRPLDGPRTIVVSREADG